MVTCTHHFILISRFWVNFLQGCDLIQSGVYHWCQSIRPSVPSLWHVLDQLHADRHLLSVVFQLLHCFLINACLLLLKEMEEVKHNVLFLVLTSERVCIKNKLQLRCTCVRRVGICRGNTTRKEPAEIVCMIYLFIVFFNQNRFKLPLGNVSQMGPVCSDRIVHMENFHTLSFETKYNRSIRLHVNVPSELEASQKIL